MKRLIFVIAALFFATQLSHAQDTQWYKVEVLVFENNDPGAVTTEAWRLEPGFPNLERSVELAPPSAAVVPPTPAAGTAPGKPPDAKTLPQQYQRLPNSALDLNKALRKLRASKRYEPLLHVAWLQEFKGDSDSGKPVHLFSSATIASGASFNTTVQPRADGLVMLRRSRFLHVDVDMVLRQAMTARAATETELSPAASLTTITQDFRLHQSRRMRSDEIHYFDHPLFGVLVQVSPYPLDE